MLYYWDLEEQRSGDWGSFKTIISILPLLLKILGNVYIVIISFPVDDVINFEINLGSFIKPFSHQTKKSGQQFKYL